MSRNGSGTMVVLNTFIAGSTITAASHNANAADFAAEITNSLATDGQSTMTGPVKLANGTVGAPGLAFGSDLDCGMYRIGANNIGIAVNGAKVLDIATTGLSITGTLQSSGALTVESGGLTVTAGGITITAGGLTVTDGGLTLSAGQYTSPVGSVGAPAFSFAGDLDCGMYRIGANNIGIAVNGAKVLDIATTGLAVTGTLSASGALTASNGLTVSAGSVSLPAGSIANAALAAPAAMVYLGTLTASNSAVLDFTTISATYDDYVFEFENLIPANDDVELWIRVGTGAGPTYQTSSYLTGGMAARSGGSNGAISRNTAIGIGDDGAASSVGNDATYGISGRATVYAANSSNIKSATYQASFIQSSGAASALSTALGGGAWTGGIAALTGIRFMFESGNITSGVIRVYGLTHA